MTDDRLNSEAAPSLPSLLVDAIKSRWLLLAVVGGFGLLAVQYLGIDFSLSRRAKLAGLTFLFLSPAGYVVGNYITSLLWNPNFIYLIDLDARELDGALYRFPLAEFRELEVYDGDLDQLTTHLYAGKSVDLEAGTVEGTWRGTLEDRELLRALSRVEECRGRLEEDAKRGFVIESQAWTIIRNATRKATLSVVETFERGTLPDDGEGIGAEIDAALDAYDLDERIRRSENESAPSEAEAAEPPAPDGAVDSGIEAELGDDQEAAADD